MGLLEVARGQEGVGQAVPLLLKDGEVPKAVGNARSHMSKAAASGHQRNETGVHGPLTGRFCRELAFRGQTGNAKMGHGSPARIFCDGQRSDRLFVRSRKGRRQAQGPQGQVKARGNDGAARLEQKAEVTNTDDKSSMIRGWGTSAMG